MNVSLSEGIARVDQIDFNNFNESTYLQDQIEAYKVLYGYYPRVVLADKIYRTRANRKYPQRQEYRNERSSIRPQAKPQQGAKRKATKAK